MRGNSLASSRQKGQVLVLSTVFLGFFSILLMGLFHVSLTVREKIRLQISADAAILSALNCESNALNTIALTNRSILANDSLAAQLNALVSESTFYRKLVERFSRLLRLIPYAGPISHFLAKGMQTVELLVSRSASAFLPLAYFSNKSLSLSQAGIRQVLPYNTYKTAKLSLEMNMPKAVLDPFSRVVLIQQARSLQKSLVDLRNSDMEKVRKGTMDKHTRIRNWKISIAGISPVKKTGGTKLENEELFAWDKLKMKVFSRLRWHWKTVLSSKSNTKDFGYHPPEKLIALLKRDHEPLLSLGIVVQSDLPETCIWRPFKKNKLTATSAGTLVYRRKTKPQESPNTLNPYWHAFLIPVASETTFKKTIPTLILEETRH